MVLLKPNFVNKIVTFIFDRNPKATLFYQNIIKINKL